MSDKEPPKKQTRSRRKTTYKGAESKPLSGIVPKTENQGKLPQSLSAIMVYRNGQFISNGFVSSHDYLNGTITFNFTPRSGEKITLVWVL